MRKAKTIKMIVVLPVAGLTNPLKAALGYIKSIWPPRQRALQEEAIRRQAGG